MKSLFQIIFSLFIVMSPLMAQIEAGTSVQITIMGVPLEEKGKVDAMYPVSANGMVNLPYIGVLRAAGLAPEALAASIQNAYKAAEIYTSPTIQVVSTAEGAGVKKELVVVGGFVRRPGPVEYNNNLTIYQAIQNAGGATEFGSLKRVTLFRGGKPKTYDVTDPQFMKIQLYPDDTIDVPQKSWRGQ
jgi:protein involved in polysaccharide export with SLBB domain